MEKKSTNKSSMNDCCKGSWTNDPYKLLVIIGLAVLIVLSIINLSGGSNNSAIDAIEEIEAMKVWGDENYDILKSIYADPKFAEQQKTQLEAGLAQIQGAPAPTPSAQPSAAAPAATSISADEISTVLDGIYAEWDTKAKFVLLEYSDFLCPFCQRQYTEGTVKELRENFPDDVYSAFVPNTRGNPSSLKIAVGAECAGDEGKFNEFIGGIFEVGPSVSNMEKVAENIGLNIANYQACVDGDKYADKVNQKMAEGTNLFGVRGTPGNVLLNTETGEFILIAGAFPYTEFATKLQQLMDK